MRARCLHALGGLLLTLAVPSTTLGGTNAGGRAFLTWDRAGADSVYAGPPSSSYALYLHLQGTPNVQSLAVHLVWAMTAGLDSLRYTIISAPVPDTSGADGGTLLGWQTNERPTSAFAGDTSYTWTIRFASRDSSHICVKYLIASGSQAETRPAMFELASVIARDEQGRLDTLAVSAGAKLMPRPAGQLSVNMVSPQAVVGATPTRLRVHGSGFGAQTRVFVQDNGLRALAPLVAAPESGLLEVEATTAFGAGSAVDVVVEQPMGEEVTLAGAFQELPQQLLAPPPPPNTPTTAAAPFHTLTVSQPSAKSTSPYAPDSAVSHPWPASLNSSTLRVVHLPSDTVAVIKSEPYNGVGLHWGATASFPSWVSYLINPPRYATSLGTLLMGGRLLSGVAGGPADGGRQLVRVTVSYRDSLPSTLWVLAGAQVRDWTNGVVSCAQDTNVIAPYLFASPTDSNVTALPTGNPNLAYDFQRVMLPEGKWKNPITSVEFRAERISRAGTGTCWVNLPTPTSGLFGASLWEDFQIRSPVTHDTLVTQLQSDPRWADMFYGGFEPDTVPRYSDATVDDNGCTITCWSTIYNYFGIPCTPAVVNVLLRHTDGGFLNNEIGYVDSIGGVAVGNLVRLSLHNPYRYDTNAGVGPFIVDSLTNRCSMSVVSQLGTVARARLVSVDSSAVARIRLGSPVSALGEANPLVVPDIFGHRYWHPAPTLGASFTADSIEAELRAGRPVVLTFRSGVAGFHAVVAKGMRPDWSAPGGPRGSYVIMDPLDDAVTLVGKYMNSWNAAYRVAVDSLPQGPRAAPQKFEGLSIAIPAGQSIALSDPVGRTVSYRVGDEAIHNEIPGCLVERGVGGGAGQDTTAARQLRDMIIIDRPLAGAFTLTSQDVMPGRVGIVVGAYADSSDPVACATSETVSSGTMLRHRIRYKRASTLTIEKIATTDVETGSAHAGVWLGCSPSPTFGKIAFVVSLPRADVVDLGVFDLSGRRVATPLKGWIAAGSRVVDWSAEAHGGRLRPGVYFARLRTSDAEVSRRLVVIGGGAE